MDSVGQDGDEGLEDEDLPKDNEPLREQVCMMLPHSVARFLMHKACHLKVKGLNLHLISVGRLMMVSATIKDSFILLLISVLTLLSQWLGKKG